MFPTMMITFREGVEAFLIIAITALYLRNTGRADLLGALRFIAVTWWRDRKALAQLA